MFAVDAIASTLYYHNTGRIIIIQHPCIINIYDCTVTIIVYRNVFGSLINSCTVSTL